MTSSSDPPFGRALVLFSPAAVAHCLTPTEGLSLLRACHSRGVSRCSTLRAGENLLSPARNFSRAQGAFEARNRRGNGKKRVAVERIWRARGEAADATSSQLASKFLTKPR